MGSGHGGHFLDLIVARKGFRQGVQTARARPYLARTPGSDRLIVVYYLLHYELVDDYMERRPEFREEHLRLARDAEERGELVLAGAYADPPDGAALVFHADDDSVARDFVAHDPYVREGLVKRWVIRQWTVVIGGG